MSDKTETVDKESEEFNFAVEFTTNEQYLSACFYAICAVSELDPMTADGKAMKKRILNRTFKIVDLCVGEMYEELFDPEKDDE
jgi:hypothetical protein